MAQRERKERKKEKEKKQEVVVLEREERERTPLSLSYARETRFLLCLCVSVTLVSGSLPLLTSISNGASSSPFDAFFAEKALLLQAEEDAAGRIALEVAAFRTCALATRCL